MTLFVGPNVAEEKVCVRLCGSVANYYLPDDLFAVEGFGQLKIFSFSQIFATLS